jgi:prephenate dehydrogenase
MADKLQIAIIGLGLVGASAGLALRRYPDKVRIIGHDREPATAGRAKAMGAVDKTEWNLISTITGADRILLALPISEVRDTLSAMAQDLKPGCVILNMASVAAPALPAAMDSLGLADNVYLVGGHPILLVENMDTGSARADLFEGKVFCLTPDSQTPGDAVNLAADLVSAMGGQALFLDAPEHDGLMAAVEHLPALLAGALLKATTNSSGWQDMRKLAGSQYYSATLLMSQDSKEAASACVANRDNVVRWIDSLSDELDELRALVAGGEEQTLMELFEKGMSVRNQWLNAQISGNWHEEPTPEMPSMGSTFRGMIGLRGLDRKPKKGK